MTIRSFLLASVTLTSFSLISQPPSWADLADDLGSASVNILDKLGYDCTTASVGILCKRCQVEDNQEKCVAYLCDGVTKKCRKKSVEIPKLPTLNRSSVDKIVS